MNRRVLPGKFTRVPLNFTTGEMTFEEAALSSMTNEWYSAAVNIQRSLVKRPRAALSSLSITISWTEPTEDGGETITDYSIYWN